jgi:hypothetical protein
VGSHEAHIADAIEDTWAKVVDDFNEVWQGKPYTTYRSLKGRYNKLLQQSVNKDPDSESFNDSEAQLWSMLEDHRRDIAAKNLEKAKGKNKKDKDDELAQQGKQERDIASVAVINRAVTRLGGKSWAFQGGKVVATKEDGTKINVNMEDIVSTPGGGGGGGRGATAASALLEMAKARQASEEKKYQLMKEEAQLKAAADQLRYEAKMKQKEAEMIQKEQQFEAEMKQRDQQFALQMQQFQLQHMAMFAQLQQSGIAFPPMMFGGPTEATFGLGNIGNTHNSAAPSNLGNRSNETGNGNNRQPRNCATLMK